MNKTIINVPPGIRYISEWEGFMLPEFPHIMDKQITGCGFTEWVITSPWNSVLISPRLILLENKEEQHLGEVFYARNDLDAILNVDRDLTKALSTVKKSEEEQEKLKKDFNVEEKKAELRNQIRNYYIQCLDEERPCKILVTYDSYRIVYDALNEIGCFDSFYTVVDEFQSIFTDSRFKSDTELEFISCLQGVQKLCFVSATPMIDTYLDMLDEFKDLPFFELDWGALEPGRIIRPQLSVHPCKRITEMAVSIIETYQKSEFEKTVIRDDSGNLQEIESRELVVYVNSVKNICDIIRRAGLTYENTNVLCSSSKENQRKIRAAFGLSRGQEGGIGKVPLRDEPRKMFTLCTRTVYLGADFYSDCARSVILSDANIECLAVDITLDLPQILGRQRLDCNPWKNRAELYIRFLSESNKKSGEEFKKYQDRKISKTKNLLSIYESSTDKAAKHDLADTYQKVAKTYNYKDNYVAVNTHGGSDLIPVFNNLVMVSEFRSFEIQQVDYPDRFRIINHINSSGKYNFDPIMSEVDDFMIKFRSVPYFTDKMKLLCESGLSEKALSLVLKQVPIDYSTYYFTLGSERMRTFGYQKSKLEKEYILTKENSFGGTLCKVILSNFKLGDRLTLAEIKETLKNLYKENNINSSPKAKILENYFNVKKTKVKNSEGKFVDGYEILSKKEK